MKEHLKKSIEKDQEEGGELGMNPGILSQNSIWQRKIQRSSERNSKIGCVRFGTDFFFFFLWLIAYFCVFIVEISFRWFLMIF